MMKTLATLAAAIALSVLASLAFAPDVPVPFGALAGPDIPSRYLKWGGVATYRGTQAMQTATTTLCAIQGPSATSTVTFGSWTVTTATGTAASIDLGVGATAYATSTTLVSATAVGSGALGAAAWAASNGTTAVIGPNQYLIVKTNGAGLGGYTFGGKCTAEFTVI